MSGHGFHVHGPHDHELEHAAQHAHAAGGHGEKDGLAGRVAVATALLATIGALFSKRSDAQLHQHHRWAQATTALQISIALAAIALLTRRKWLLWGMLGVSGVGMALGALAALHI